MGNRLQYETSEYLLQHKDNPVDWMAWGAEAFERAQREEKPIFLSIGYATCHWCHVMSKESFEDDQIACILNQNFISIKVDKEEHPEVGETYMAACICRNEYGEWPLTVLLSADKKPFWVGTYLPKTTRAGNTGLMGLLQSVCERWQDSRRTLLDSGDVITERLLEQSQWAQREQPISIPELLQSGAQELCRSYDRRWGGLVPPKFPAAHNLLFLLRHGSLNGLSHCCEIAKHTLTAMYCGGLFDCMGGGFFRYTTDRGGLVPRFEKMLCDNAMLAMAYIEGYRCTKQIQMDNVARWTLDYILRELRAPQGGFFCGQNTDNHSVDNEGGHCLLPPKRKQMYQERPPMCDDATLTSWNGLAMVSLARGAFYLNEPFYLQAARDTQQFIVTRLTDKNGRLRLRWCKGKASQRGKLEDYAYYLWGLIELYHATYELQYLDEAIELYEIVASDFGDDSGGFYMCAIDDEQPLLRIKNTQDRDMPCGNSVMALVLSQLFRLTGEDKWRWACDQQVKYLASIDQSAPLAGGLLYALTQQVSSPLALVCAVSSQDCAEEIREYLRNECATRNVVALVKSPENEAWMNKIAPFTKCYPVPDHGQRYYLCGENGCKPPVESLAELRMLLNRLPPWWGLLRGRP